MSVPRGLRRDFSLAALTLLLSVLLFPGALLRGEAFFERDLHLDWYPRQAALLRCLHEGSWPLWDLSLGFGQPLLADPGSQAAYPGAWLALLAPPAHAYTVFVVFHLLLAGLGAARLARAVGARGLGALAAGLLFALSGPLQSSVNLWHHFAGAAWLPWVWLAADRALRDPRPRRSLALAAVAALQVLAGSADLCAMTWAAAGAGGLRAARRRGRGAARPLLALAAAAALCVGVTAVLWWPAADVVSRSTRRDLPVEVRGAWSVPAEGLLRLAAPLDPRRVPFTAEAWQRLYDRPGEPFLHSLYLGPLVLALAGVALFTGRVRSRALVLAGLAAAAVLFAMGPHGPLYPPATFLLPPLRVFRYPSKATLLAALALALLAGLGVDAIRRGLVARRGGAWAGGLVVLATIALGLVAWRHGVAPAPVLLLPGLTGAAVLGLLGGRQARPALVAAVLTALACGDLLAAHAGLNAAAPAALVFSPPPIVGRVDRREGRRLYVYDYHSVAGTASRLLGRGDPYRYLAAPPGGDRRLAEVAALRQYLPPPAAGLFGLEGSFDLDIRGLYPRDLNDLTWALRRFEGSPVHGRLLRLGAVGTVVALHESGLSGVRRVALLPSLFPEPIRVFAVENSLPRSWVVGCARAVDGRVAFEALAGPDFDPAREVLLPSPALAGSACGVAGSSRILELRQDGVTLEVAAERAGAVVLADAYDPGWVATVDGAAAPVLRANVAFRAVVVEAGRHLVALRYRPRPVLQGLAVSGVTLLGALALALAAVRRRRH